jgi:hypothetical protein
MAECAYFNVERLCVFTVETVLGGVGYFAVTQFKGTVLQGDSVFDTVGIDDEGCDGDIVRIVYVDNGLVVRGGAEDGFIMAGAYEGYVGF